jgi:transcriptional/translational regulatory protein YebC/TACO1
MEVALEAGAQDVIRNEDDSVDVLTTTDDFEVVRTAMEKANLNPEQAEITLRATTSSSLDLDNAQKMVRFLDLLEDLDDVQQVYSNADISEAIMAKLT